LLLVERQPDLSTWLLYPSAQFFDWGPPLSNLATRRGQAGVRWRQQAITHLCECLPLGLASLETHPDLPIFWGGVYRWSDAMKLAAEIVDRSMIFEDDVLQGRIVVVHCNALRALRLLKTANQVVHATSKEHRVTILPSLRSELWDAWTSPQARRRAQREHFVELCLREQIPHRVIAESLLAEKLVEPTWTEGPDAVESTRIQVSRIANSPRIRRSVYIFRPDLMTPSETEG
jgi:hypothetical protein